MSITVEPDFLKYEGKVNQTFIFKEKIIILQCKLNEIAFIKNSLSFNVGNQSELSS